MMGGRIWVESELDKGSAGNIRAERLQKTSYQLELMGREGRLTAASGVTADLEQELEAFRDALKAYGVL